MVAGIPGAPSMTAWTNFVKDPQAQLERFRNQPEVQKKIDAFKKAWADLANEEEPIEKMFKDRGIANVVLSAFQLEADIDYVARNEKIVSESLSDENSLVNRLIDGRYRDMARTINYDLRGRAVFSSPRTIDEIVNKYVINEFEKAMGASNPGLREAAYFARNARNVTDVYQLLGDPVLRSVTIGGLQLPQQISYLEVDKQAQMIEDRLDIDKLSRQGTTDLGTLIADAEAAKRQRDLLQPALNMAQAASDAVTSVSTRLQAIQDEFTAIDSRIDPLGSNAAQITFQEGQLDNYLQADGLISAAERAIGDIDTSLSRLKTLYQQTVGLNPVGDATQIAANKQEYTDLVNKIESVINGATYVDPSSATTRSLLLAIPGPGVTSINWQQGSASAVQTLTGGDLQTFINDLQSAATDFNAGNYANAQSSVYATQGSYFTVKSDIAAGRTNFENTVGSIGQYFVTLDSANLDRGYDSVNSALDRTNSIIYTLGQLRTVATELTDGALLPADRTTKSATFFSLQASLNSLITSNPVGTDNLLTNAAGFSYNIYTGVNMAAQGKNFTDPAYNGVRTPPVGPDVTVADANNFLTAFNTSGMLNEANSLYTSLSGEKSAFEMAVKDFDPYADVVADLKTLKNDLPTIKNSANANNNENNALKRGESPLTVRLTGGQSYTVNVFENYDNDVEAFISAAAIAYDTSPATARTNITTALRNLGDYRTDTASQLRPIKYDYDRFVDTANTLEAQAGDTSDSDSPYDGANSFVLQFIQRYLVLGQTSSQSASNAYQLQLLPNAGGGLNLSSLI